MNFDPKDTNPFKRDIEDSNPPDKNCFTPSIIFLNDHIIQPHYQNLSLSCTLLRILGTPIKPLVDGGAIRSFVCPEVMKVIEN